MPALPTFSLKSIALKWTRFFVMGNILPFEEYFSLFMQQLGLSASQIGMTWLFGLPSLSIVFTSYIADRFRARKLMLVVSEILLVLLSLATAMPLLVSSLQICATNTSYTTPARNYSAKPETVIMRPTTMETSGFINISWSKSNLAASFDTEGKVRQDNHSGEGGMKKVEGSTGNQGNVSSNAIALSVFATLVKVSYDVVRRLLLTLIAVANMTYLKNDKSKLGWYYAWGHVSSGLVLLLVGLLASRFETTICDQVCPAYVIVFPVASVMIVLALAATPLIEYEYLEKRVIKWSDVSGVLCEPHYVVMLLVAFYSGCGHSILYFWQYWFVNYLGGGPHVLAYGSVLRRFCFIPWLVIIPECVERLGELRLIAVGLLLFVIKDCALSFVHNPWFTLPIDVIQVGATTFTTLPLIIHFSKPGTKASSAAIMGILEVAFSAGQGFGGNGFGVLFSAIGPRMTLRLNSIFCGIVLVSFLVYICCRKDIGNYEKVPQSESESQDGW